MIRYACRECHEPLRGVAYTVDELDYCGPKCAGFAHGRQRQARELEEHKPLEAELEQLLLPGAR
jgi:hypothetical protein